MKTHLSHRLLDVVQRLANAPQQTLSKVSARFGAQLPEDPALNAAPDHVVRRLESVFEALSDLSFQPDIAAALDLVCDTLQAELPTAAVAAGVYDINSDEIRIVAARGLEYDLLHGTVMPRERCFASAAEHAIIIRGDAADWLGTGEQDSTVLLCPVLHDGHLLGVLALAEPLCTAEFDHHDLELLGYVAEQTAGFIKDHRLRPSLAPPVGASSR
jgi:GAF domain-containing protein